MKPETERNFLVPC